MEEQHDKHWWTSLPATIVAVTGLVGTVGGVYLTRDKPSEPDPPAVVVPEPSAPDATRVEGWAVVGNYAQGRLDDALIKVRLDMPLKGEICEALADFSVFQGSPKDSSDGGKIRLGDVHKGEMVEVLDVWRKDEKGAEVNVNLRAALHSHFARGPN